MFDRSSSVGDALDTPSVRAVLDRMLPGVTASPMATQFRGARLGQLVSIVPDLRDDPALQEELWAELATLDGGAERREYLPAVVPDPAYESVDVPRSSARIEQAAPVALFGRIDVVLHGPDHGNPFLDVELTAEFRLGDRALTVGGFYDGDGVYRLRMLAEATGTWEFETASTARSLDGLRGSVVVTADPAGPGPVRVDGMHFRYADGTRYRPVGTTGYAWTHQTEEVQQRTLATLADSPFTKLRMCVFPKSYLYNTNEPERFPFPGNLADGFDLERFDVEYFRALEGRIDDLAALGVQADLILFHAYDRWGFADLGPAVDDRVVRYLVRRLAGHANIWWSMANEYDLVWSKSLEDWERLAQVVVENDPHRHLLSIHNCFGFFDHSREWITHVSAQRIDVYRTAENVDAWRAEWNKPVVVDECGYEGDLDQGWGNLTAEEMTRRCWEGAVRGGYVAHGETYLRDDEVLWWSKGGELTGDSPARMRFLDAIVAEAPNGCLDPLASDWDVPWGGVAGNYLVGYFGLARPRFRHVVLPPGDFVVDVIDTWAMTIDEVPGVHNGSLRVELPARQYMAIRVRAVGDGAVGTAAVDDAVGGTVVEPGATA